MKKKVTDCPPILRDRLERRLELIVSKRDPSPIHKLENRSNPIRKFPDPREKDLG